MAIEPKPGLTKAGKYFLYTLGIFACVIVFGLVLQACIRRPPRVAEQTWTQGYEHPSGQYMEPDHGALYYWWVTRMLQRDVQPTYHVYYPPPNYPPTYRPWQEREYVRAENGQFVRRPPTAATPARTSGGFSGSATPTAAPARHQGGFAVDDKGELPPSKSRTSGGFSSSRSTSTPKAEPRSSGGFSSSSTPASKPASAPRSSGGFSKKK